MDRNIPGLAVFHNLQLTSKEFAIFAKIMFSKGDKTKKVMAKNNVVQQRFISKIKGMLPSNISLAEELADILEISNDSAYRRLRCETSFTIEEVHVLCNHFRITFDTFDNSAEGTVTFNYQPLEKQEQAFQKYLQNICNDLKKINSFDEKQIIFAAEDIPIFHHFRYPGLTEFKIFYWNKSILNTPSFEGKKFKSGSIDAEVIQISNEIIDLYDSIPSIEIWSEDTINSTVKQIEFYWESGLFESTDEAIKICDDFQSLLDGIQKKAEKCSKSDSAENNYTLYNSEVMIGNNCILVNMNQAKATYLSHHTFNAMITTNPAFCNETDIWLKNLIKKSILISGTGEKQRYQFFRKISDSFNKLKHTISNS